MEIDIEELFRLYLIEVDTIETLSPETRLDLMWNACGQRASSGVVTVMWALSKMFCIEAMSIESSMTRLPSLKRVSDIEVGDFDSEDMCKIIRDMSKLDRPLEKKYVGVTCDMKSSNVIWVDDGTLVTALALIWTLFKMDVKNVKEIACEPEKLNKCLSIFGKSMSVGEWRWSVKGGNLMGVVRVHPGSFSVSVMQRLAEGGYNEVKTTHFMKESFGLDSIRAAVDNPELKGALEALVKNPRRK